MDVSKFSFRVSLAQAGPPGWKSAPAAARADLARALVAFALEEKDADLAAGIGADGKALAALALKTRENRRSAMGPADPNAPALTPAHGLSRTRSLLTGRVEASGQGAVFWWKFDPVTAKDWGEILDHHRKGAGRLPVRDVFGLSPQAVARVRRRLREWWRAYQVGRASVPVAAEPAALPTPAPAFVVQSVPEYVPKFPELAVAKNPHHVSRIEINGKRYVLGAGIGGRATAASIRKSIAAGTFSGFRREADVLAPAARLAAAKARLGIGRPPDSGGGAVAVLEPPKPPPRPTPKPQPQPPATPARPTTRPMRGPTTLPATPRLDSDFSDVGPEPGAQLGWLRARFAGWEATVTPKEREAIHAYTSGWYKRINERLRDRAAGRRVANDAVGRKTQEYANLMEKAVRRAALPEDVRLWRGFDATTLEADPRSLVGKVLEHPSLVSATLSRRVAEQAHFARGALFRINAPRGTPGAPTGIVVGQTEEMEIVFPPGTKFLVKAVRREDGLWVVDVEIVP